MTFVSVDGRIGGGLSLSHEPAHFAFSHWCLLGAYTHDKFRFDGRLCSSSACKDSKLRPTRDSADSLSMPALLKSSSRRTSTDLYRKVEGKLKEPRPPEALSLLHVGAFVFLCSLRCGLLFRKPRKFKAMQMQLWQRT